MTEGTGLAYVFPGQGSQRVGMGRDLYAGFEEARTLFKQVDEILGFSLSKLCFEGPEEDLRQTRNAQPAIVTVSLACLKVAQSIAGNRMPRPSFVAGHSLGEYAALAAGGVLDFATAVYLTRERGRLMYEAGQLNPGGMAAILGMDEPAVEAICRETGTWLANINCPGQLVISGGRENIGRAVALAQERGASRAIMLQVSGAFHTPLMQPATDGMSEAIAKLRFQNALVPIIANTTAEPLIEAEPIKAELLRQLTTSVQWQRSIEYMVGAGVSTFIEIGPGKVLTGLIKRISKNAKTVSIGDAIEIKSFVNGLQ